MTVKGSQLKGASFAKGIDYMLLFFGVFLLYLGLHYMYTIHEMQNLEDRQMILEEIVDNANDVIFQKYQMVWSTDKHGMWIACEIQNPRCNLFLNLRG